MVGTLRFARLRISRRLPILGRKFEFRKLKPRCDRASDQRPSAGAFGGLPCIRRHDRLRLLTGSDVGAELETPLAAVIRDLQGQRAAGIIVPDF